jgi:hypothetical protein
MKFEVEITAEDESGFGRFVSLIAPGGVRFRLYQQQ